MPASRLLSPIARNGLAALIVVLLCAVYGAALWNGYVYDDTSLIEANPRVTSLGAALGAFFDPLWSFGAGGASSQTGFWRPLTLLVIALGRGLSGGAAWGPHLISLVLHAGATLLVIRLARRLLKDDLAAGLVGLLFALHPVHVQSVAWAAAVNDPLFALLSLGALGAYLRWHDRGRAGVPVAAASLFLLGLLAKEQALVVLPLALLLEPALRADTEPGQRGGSGRGLAALTVAALLWYALRVYAFGEWQAGLGGAVTDFRLDAGRAWSLRLELFGGFLGLLAWPAELPFFRGVAPEIPDGDSRLLFAGLATAVWVALAGWAAWRRSWTVLWLAAAMALPQAFVVVNFESAGAYPLQDRYLYLSVLGFAGLITWLCATRLPRPLGLAALALVAGAYGWRSLERIAIYESDETFFRTAVAESPDVAWSHLGLGRVLLSRYHTGLAKEDLDEAMVSYLTALTLGHDYGERGPQLGPDAPLERRLRELQAVIHGPRAAAPRPDPHVMVSVSDRLEANLGQAWCLLYAGKLPPSYDMEAARAVFAAITQAFPNEARAWEGLGTAEMESRKFDQAQASFGKAIELDRGSAVAWSNMARNLAAKGDFDGARGAFQEAVRLSPGKLEYRLEWVQTMLDGGRLDLAERELKNLGEELGRGPELDFLEGMLHARRGQFPQALDALDRALAAEPGLGRAHLQRGNVLAAMNQGDQAMDAYGRACTLLPDSFEAHYNLAILLLQQPSAAAQARDFVQRAYQLGNPGEQRIVLLDQIASALGKDADGHWKMLTFDAGRGDHRATLEWVGRILQLNRPWADKPDREARLAAVHQLGGRALKELGEIERAIGSLQLSLSLDSESFWSWLYLAEAWDSAARANEALQAAGEARVRLEGAKLGADMRPAIEEQLDGIVRRNEQRLQQAGPEIPLEGIGPGGR